MKIKSMSQNKKSSYLSKDHSHKKISIFSFPKQPQNFLDTYKSLTISSKLQRLLNQSHLKIINILPLSYEQYLESEGLEKQNESLIKLYEDNQRSFNKKYYDQYQMDRNRRKVQVQILKDMQNRQNSLEKAYKIKMPSGSKSKSRQSKSRCINNSQSQKNNIKFSHLKINQNSKRLSTKMSEKSQKQNIDSKNSKIQRGNGSYSIVNYKNYVYAPSQKTSRVKIISRKLSSLSAKSHRNKSKQQKRHFHTQYDRDDLDSPNYFINQKNKIKGLPYVQEYYNKQRNKKVVFSSKNYYRQSKNIQKQKSTIKEPTKSSQSKDFISQKISRQTEGIQNNKIQSDQNEYHFQQPYKNGIAKNRQNSNKNTNKQKEMCKQLIGQLESYQKMSRKHKKQLNRQLNIDRSSRSKLKALQSIQRRQKQQKIKKLKRRIDTRQLHQNKKSF